MQSRTMGDIWFFIYFFYLVVFRFAGSYMECLSILHASQFSSLCTMGKHGLTMSAGMRRQKTKRKGGEVAFVQQHSISVLSVLFSHPLFFSFPKIHSSFSLPFFHLSFLYIVNPFFFMSAFSFPLHHREEMKHGM